MIYSISCVELAQLHLLIVGNEFSSPIHPLLNHFATGFNWSQTVVYYSVVRELKESSQAVTVSRP